MPKINKLREPISADRIAAMAERGDDISRFFTRQGKRMPVFADPLPSVAVNSQPNAEAQEDPQQRNQDESLFDD